MKGETFQMPTFDVYENKNQAVRDAYAMLAANIQINNKQHKQQLIIVTSCNPQEGKTTLAINLSIALANSGFNVLLIDTDMRKPEKAKRLYQNVQMGLSDYINGRIELSEAIIKTNINHFSYLASGRHDPNPIALLSSSRFEGLVEKIRKDQALDYVIFDTPALTSVADGALVASKGDAALIVAKMGYTKTPDLKRVKEQLERMNVTILGVVLNKVKKLDYKVHYRSYDYFFDAEHFYNNEAFGKKEAQNKKETLSKRDGILS